MPSPPAVVRLVDGRVVVIDRVTPDGKGDQAWDEDRRQMIALSVDDIEEILWEPEGSDPSL